VVWDAGVYSLEVAVLFLVAMAVVMSIVQIGLWWYSRDVAITAARAGVEAARADHGSVTTGEAAARASLDRFGSTLDDQQVSPDGSTASQVRITVTGHVATLIPGWTLTVTQSANGPKEEWTP
jgi:TadE-like protein